MLKAEVFRVDMCSLNQYQLTGQYILWLSCKHVRKHNYLDNELLYRIQILKNYIKKTS